MLAVFNQGVNTVKAAVPSSIVVFSIPSGSNGSISVNLTAVVTGSNPTGTVTWTTNTTTGIFSDVTTTLDVSGNCQTTYNDTKTGAVNITASYNGDTNNEASSMSAILQIIYAVDFNQDGSLNFSDVVYFVTAYINYNGNSIYNPISDLNGDTKINFQDLALFAQDYVGNQLAMGA